MKLLLLVFLLLPIVVSKCGTKSSCGTCAGTKDGFASCLWCASDNGCHSSLQNDCPKVDKITHTFDCPTQPYPAFAYDENFARNVALVLSAASNGENNTEVQTCLDKTGSLLTRQYTVPCDSKGDTCSGYVAYNPAANAIILVFRGSKDSAQFIIEGADFLFNKMTAFSIVGGNVDQYFSDGFNAVWNAGMENDLKALLVQYHDCEIWTIGHSLGGSMASMASAYVVAKRYTTSDKVKLVTFGQPRTGDIQYAEAHDKLVNYHYRIIHKNDPIPHMPAKAFDDLFDSPFHHRFEVWYNNDMLVGDPYVICDRADDNDCSNGVGKTDAAAHVHYFNKDLSVWYQTGCA